MSIQQNRKSANDAKQSHTAPECCQALLVYYRFVSESAASEVAGGFRVVEAVAVLLQGGRRQMHCFYHGRQLQVHERIPRMHRASCHYTTHRQVTCVIYLFILNIVHKVHKT